MLYWGRGGGKPMPFIHKCLAKWAPKLMGVGIINISIVFGVL